MNVVLVNDHLSLSGGVARVAISEATGLARRGHRVTYFGASGLPSEELLCSGIDIHALNQPEILDDTNRLGAAWRGINNAEACRELTDVLSRLDPADTIVHFHSWMKALSPRILSVPAERGFRSVLSLHDFFIRCPNGGFIEHANARICHRKPLGFSCLACNCDSRSYAHKGWRVARQVFQDVIWKTPHRVDGYIAVSNFCSRILRPYLPDSKRIDVIHNPVAVEHRAPEREREDYFLFVGRLSREKGAATFAEAARMAGVRCRFVGDGGEMETLRRIHPEAEFCGWLPHNQVIEEMRKAQALVFPSIWYETQGLSVLEALANGTPVIVSDCTAAAEYVKDGETGLHFKAGNAADLAQKLAQVEERGSTLGRNGYQWFWNDPWSLEKHLTELEAAYHRAHGVN